MIRYVAARTVSLVLVLLGASLVTFALSHLASTDPAVIILSKQHPTVPPAPDEVQALRHELGLDRPVAVQYGAWLRRALRGDLGTSWTTGLPVFPTLVGRLPATAVLAASSLGLALLISVPVGLLAAFFRNSFLDHASRLLALGGASVPNYVQAYVLILIFAVSLNMLPAFGYGSVDNLVLPSLTLALGGTSAMLTRLTRSAVLEVLGEDYMKLAKSKGLPSRRIAWHALRNALLPIATAATLSLGHLLGGVIIVEWIFAWPGLGKLSLDAISARDYPLLQGVVWLAVLTYVILNFLTDIAYGWIDPRVRVSVRGSLVAA